VNGCLSVGELDVGADKQAHLHWVVRQFVLRNGTALFSPYGQGLEPGPQGFFAHPAAGGPIDATDLIFRRNAGERK
jgi:class I fructose-bisphosphate aldolase